MCSGKCFFLLVDSLKNTFQPFFSSILQTDFFEKRRLNIKTNYSFFFSQTPDKNFIDISVTNF